MTKKNVIVIIGQTGTGKSALAVKLAKKFNGEIISADSRQVYKYLDIGTDKISKKAQAGVAHHLIDVVNPKYKFTVAEYKELAKKKIQEILKRGKVPIICGGTGFYIDAVVKGLIFPEVPPDNILRKKLEKNNPSELFEMLKKLDSRRAKNIDKKNKVRLIRAIEITKYLGKVPKIKKILPGYNFVKIGLQIEDADLIKKIENRAKKMFKRGLLQEIKKLKRLGVGDKRLNEFGFEYWKPTPQSIIIGTLKYAKRQSTWFKRDKEIEWFSPIKYNKIESYISKNIL